MREVNPSLMDIANRELAPRQEGLTGPTGMTGMVGPVGVPGVPGGPWIQGVAGSVDMHGSIGPQGTTVNPSLMDAERRQLAPKWRMVDALNGKPVKAQARAMDAFIGALRVNSMTGDLWLKAMK